MWSCTLSFAIRSGVYSLFWFLPSIFTGYPIWVSPQKWPIQIIWSSKNRLFKTIAISNQFSIFNFSHVSHRNFEGSLKQEKLFFPEVLLLRASNYLIFVLYLCYTLAILNPSHFCSSQRSIIFGFRSISYKNKILAIHQHAFRLLFLRRVCVQIVIRVLIIAKTATSVRWRTILFIPFWNGERRDAHKKCWCS